MVDLAAELGWSKTGKGSERAELRSTAEELTMTAKPLAVVQAPLTTSLSQWFGGTLSFDQNLQLEKEKAKTKKKGLVWIQALQGDMR